MQKDVGQPFPTFNAATMSSTNTIYSNVSNILHKDSVGIELSWTGSPVGTFSVQVSNSYKPALAQTEGYGAPQSGTWTTLPLTDPLTGLTTLTRTTSVGSPIFINLNQLASACIQIVYTNSSGSGVLTGIITSKSLG